MPDTRLFLLLLCLLMSACAPGGPGSEALLSSSQLRTAMAKLPGAQVIEGNPLRISYPSGILFAEASVLPMPGGPEQLDPLMTLIRQSGVAWQLRVHAVSGEGEKYDRLLAAERVKVLRTYLKSSGVDLLKITITAVSGSGVPLELSIAE